MITSTKIIKSLALKRSGRARYTPKSPCTWLQVETDDLPQPLMLSCSDPRIFYISNPFERKDIRGNDDDSPMLRSFNFQFKEPFKPAKVGATGATCWDVYGTVSNTKYGNWYYLNECKGLRCSDWAMEGCASTPVKSANSLMGDDAICIDLMKRVRKTIEDLRPLLMSSDLYYQVYRTVVMPFFEAQRQEFEKLVRAMEEADRHLSKIQLLEEV